MRIPGPVAHRGPHSIMTGSSCNKCKEKEMVKISMKISKIIQKSIHIKLRHELNQYK